MRVRILVVEDYAPFRRIACAALQRREEFEIFEAVDGLEAVQKVEELLPDLILLDINLPHLHGFQVAARTRTLAPRTRILFVSQESSPDIVEHGFTLGGHGYLHKERSGTDLLPAIDAVLSGQRFVSSSVNGSKRADRPAPHRHEILFCTDDAAIVDGLTDFIGAALNAADAAIVLATEPHRNRLLEELRTQGIDVDGAVARGTYLSFDSSEAPDPGRFIDAINTVREAATRAGKPHPRIALCGERAGSLWAAGRTAEAVALEQFCGELAHDVDILCLYPIPYAAGDRALERMCAEHTAVSAS